MKKYNNYIGGSYRNNNRKGKMTLQEIVENQEKHILLIPRSYEDQEYLDELSSKIVKNIPNDIIIEKCKSSFSGFDDSGLKEEEVLNLVCTCHNCDSAFPLRNIKWVDRSDDEINKWPSMEPMCAKYPICPSSWSCFDLRITDVQYSIEDHKNGKYTMGSKNYALR